ncbi:MAG: membrane protein insertase YidC [Deltaproteobacteria bacterium HGW-Deltaproteobacteria-19]|jgi:YidC/Oxa1 family membrane protein insertase|nr:MAG: membrane protein insertase YidC [Deltaproteobacteria bacterium HGW-Deltaproteobacteria-19]
MDKKTILAIVLSVLVVLLYQIFFMKPPAKTPPAAQTATKQETPAASQTTGAAPAAVTAPSQTAASPAVASLQPTTVPEKDVRIETPLYTAIFSTRGATLKSLKLKGYRQAINQDSELIDLVDVKTGMPRPLTMTFPESDLNVPAESSFEVNAASLDLTTGQESRSLTFSVTYPGEIRIDKTFTFHPSKYVIDLEVKATNLSGRPLNQNGSLNWNQYVDPKAETDSYTHVGPITMVGKDVELQEIKKLETNKLLGPNVAWTGFENKYFISALVPQNPSLSSVSLAKDGRDMTTVSLKGPKNLIPPGQAGYFLYSMFLGPKDHGLLKAQGVGLEDSVDFGSWLKWLAMPMLWVLNYIYKYLPNYGIAIIVLTLIIKIIFWPLGNISYRSMKEMQKLQPRMKEIQEKFKSDRQRLSQETMALYKAHKINPMSGCLPMLIQIPVFFGLYKALMYAIELRHSPLIWWIQDLSAKDPYYITPVIMGATMWLQQKMTPSTGDAMQQKIMLWMPVIFTFLFLNFPSGLVIYWLFNNIFSIGQQYYINKKVA